MPFLCFYRRDQDENMADRNDLQYNTDMDGPTFPRESTVTFDPDTGWKFMSYPSYLKQNALDIFPKITILQ